MANLTNRLALEGKASSLDGILAEVAGWLDQYHVLDASALVKCCTQIHDRMREEIQGPTAGYISDLCTATNCVLLDHILRLLVRLQPQFADLVCLVRDELYESIFVTPPESCRDFLAADGAAPSPAALSVPDAQLRAAKMAAHGDGLWASKAKLLASTHTAHSRLRDSASDGGSQVPHVPWPRRSAPIRPPHASVVPEFPGTFGFPVFPSGALRFAPPPPPTHRSVFSARVGTAQIPLWSGMTCANSAREIYGLAPAALAKPVDPSGRRPPPIPRPVQPCNTSTQSKT